MSAPVTNQIDGLRQLARLLNPTNLKRCSALLRPSEAQHLIDMLRDAAETMEKADIHGRLDDL